MTLLTALDNLRYAVDVCVFAFANTTSGSSSPCALDQTCGPMKEALEAGNMDPAKANGFEYCTLSDGVFPSQGSSCSQCLGLSPGRKYLSNCAFLSPQQRHPQLTPN